MFRSLKQFKSLDRFHGIDEFWIEDLEFGRLGDSRGHSGIFPVLHRIHYVHDNLKGPCHENLVLTETVGG